MVERPANKGSVIGRGLPPDEEGGNKWAGAVATRKENYSSINPNIMKLFFLHLPVKNHQDELDKHTLVTIREEYNTSEGGEFLNDAIRMEDQPLIMHTEESIGVGSPEGFL